MARPSNNKRSTLKYTFIKRIQILGEVKNILNEKGYLEVETPILNTIAGGAAARPFITHHNTLDMDMYLRIANELYLKRLIVGGFDKVYEMGRMFRNEGMDIKHNPEFTNIELYSAYEDYNDMMDITEEIISKVAQKVLGTTKITYQGTEIDLTPSWKRISMIDSIKEVTGVDFGKIETDEEALKAAKELNVELDELKLTRGEIIKKLEKINYIAINTKTQIVTPTIKGEAIYDVVYSSMPDMLNPKLTASWEKGLEMVANKEIKSEEFMGKLEKYINSKFDKLVVKY